MSPKKPTSPFGHLSFSKDGNVSRHMFRLSEQKEAQQLEVVNRFAALLNRCSPGAVSDIAPLPERGHDARMNYFGRLTEVEVTELVEHAVTTQEPGPSNFAVMAGEHQFYVSEEQRRFALRESIQKKLRRYQHPTNAGLLLLVFTTSPLFNLVVHRDGIRYMTDRLRAAREALELEEAVVFDDIWFTDLQTIPTQIWPIEYPELPLLVEHGRLRMVLRSS